MYKSITGNDVQDALVTQFMDSRYFGDQHWFAARAEIAALNEKIIEQQKEIDKLNGEAAKGSTRSGKSDSVKKGE